MLFRSCECNIIDERTFNKIKHGVKLRKSSIILHRYNDFNPIGILGEFTTRVKYNGIYRSVEFVVTSGSGGNRYGSGSGGSGGAATSGSATYITWVATGTRYGAIN